MKEAGDVVTLTSREGVSSATSSKPSTSAGSVDGVCLVLGFRMCFVQLLVCKRLFLFFLFFAFFLFCRNATCHFGFYQIDIL